MVNFKNLAVTATALLSGALAAPMVDDSGSASIQAESTISGSYIVTLKDGVDAATAESHIQWVGDVHKRSINKRDSKGVEKTYTGNFNGYAGSFDESTLQEIRNNPDVSITCCRVGFCSTHTNSGVNRLLPSRRTRSGPLPLSTLALPPSPSPCRSVL